MAAIPPNVQPHSQKATKSEFAFQRPGTTIRMPAISSETVARDESGCTSVGMKLL